MILGNTFIYQMVFEQSPEQVGFSAAAQSRDNLNQAVISAY